MGTKKFISEQLESIDSPIKKTGFFSNWFKKDKIKIILIYEDNSYKEFYKNFPKSYFFDIKNKSYLLVPKCIIKGKNPTIIFYYNNPLPLFLNYEMSKLSSYDLRSEQQKNLLREEQKTLLKNVYLDSDAINTALHTRFLKGLFDYGGFTYKSILIILVVVVIIIIVFLQIFGVVDVVGAISGTAGKVK